MNFLRWSLPGTLLTLLAAACSPSPDSLDERAAESGAVELPSVAYYREYIFVASGEAEPLIVPFSFRTREVGEELDRQARGWLARGATWDRFLDVSTRTSAAGGVWRVVPHPEVRVIAGGAAELEGFRFELGERLLRL
jgi:hypothetical protein